jgi:hypothetical protein
MRKQSIIPLLMAMGASFDGETIDYPKQEKIIIERPPKGAKEYFFNSLGEFSTEKMLRSECVFKCFAINDKNAKRKFKKFQP